MSETVPTSNEGVENPTIEGSERTFTQDEVNKLVGRARKEAAHKNENYELYKSAYEEYEQLKERNKTELEKAQDKAAKLENQLKALEQKEKVASWKREVAEATGVPADVLRGSTKEDIEEHASVLQKAFAKPSAPIVGSDGLYPNKTKGKSTKEEFSQMMDEFFA